MKLALKVIYFAINYRHTRGSISPCNIAGFIWDVSEEAATQTAKICRRRQPHCHLTPPSRGTPANIPINLIFPETRFIGLHFCPDRMGLSSFTVVQWAPKDASFLRQSAFWPFKVIQGHSRSSIFGTNRKRIYDFLLVINSNHGPILHRY